MSGFVLDTNVLSERLKPAPSEQVALWMDSQPAGTLYLPTIVIGEIAAGIEALAAGRRRARLETWLSEELVPSFRGKILVFDEQAALEFGRLKAESQRAGRPTTTADTQIAAVAAVHGLAVATRDVADFAGFGVPLVNPWQGA